MSNVKTKTILSLLLTTALTVAVLEGCSSTSTPPTTQSDTATTQPAFAFFGPPPVKSGVELWSENCARCHNMRPPEEFSGAQWEVIVHHMRTRANLTGTESREIVKFLQAGG